MPTSRTDTSATTRVPRQLTVRLGGAAGQVIEWYDFTIYGYFAVFLAPQFFPAHSEVAGLLATFVGLLSTFVTRPLGAVVVGHFADRLGRRRILAVTIFGASLSAAVIGLLPSASSIGVAASVLVVLCRLTQGIFTGGEVPAAGSLVLEHAPARHRAFSASWVQVGAAAGSILALLVATLLSTVLPHDALAAWGWRIPFLIAAPLGAVGWFVRARLTETPEFTKLAAHGEVVRAPIVELVTSPRHLGQILRLLGVFLCGSFFAFYIFLTYVPTYLLGHAHLGERATFASALLAQCFMICVIPLAGRLADRVGRRPVLFAAQALFVVLSVPVFLLMGLGTFGFVLLAQLVIVIPIGLHQAVQIPIMLELLPTRVRVSGGGLAFGIASALFGGTAPIFAVWLVGRTGTGTSVAIAVVVAALISMAATLVTAETGRRELEA
ncbi:MFS transporter [Amycolatopsis sp. OK19-0408]|uniref:MFS transporter n=1 Tax=Amycolatopsis iheyensis TaxID=2945988 RepID=A0A9X2NH64_9PSEU|nr:MFS transporter [Amycolatopsis iheyensis]MCR6487753.1 MFS transporter [Amycolatopsis iheyensis]